MDIIELDERLTEENFGYKSDMAAGVDLRACNVEGSPSRHSFQLYPSQIVIVGTGICIDMKDAGMCGFVIPRSSTGTLGVSLANTVGLIDPDYQGEILLKVKNTSDNAILIEPLDRIAQLVFLPVLRPNFNFVKSFSNETGRGSGGFGSTGIK